MIVAGYVFLGVLLLVLLRQALKTNRRVELLKEAIQTGRPYLHESGTGRATPQWIGLTQAVNRLIIDNTALHQQRSDQLAQLEATLGNLREAVLIVDESNYIHLANRALREVFPAVRNVVNLRLEIVVRSAPFHRFVAAIRAGEPLPRQEFEIIDGPSTLWIEASGAPIPSPDGKSQWALFVIHDMTSQRKLERVRRDFVANASHELRTPLSVIKGYIETLVDGHATMPEPDRDRFLKAIQRHSERLDAIIFDLLALSKLESSNPGLQFEPVELAPLLESVGDDYRRRSLAAGHRIKVDAPSPLGSIQADAVKLAQVFGNLLDNAIKYTPKGSEIVISGKPLDSGDVELSVRDDGPGIPAADLPHIFERFYRVDKGRSRETGGTGLGLSIVKHIALLHGGRAWAESEPGRGTAIILRLPREQPATSPAAAIAKAG